MTAEEGLQRINNIKDAFLRYAGWKESSRRHQSDPNLLWYTKNTDNPWNQESAFEMEMARVGRLMFSAIAKPNIHVPCQRCHGLGRQDVMVKIGDRLDLFAEYDEDGRRVTWEKISVPCIDCGGSGFSPKSDDDPLGI